MGVRGRGPVEVAPDTSSDVIARIRGGDEDAFEELFRAHYPPLCEFAARYVRDDAMAEELVQDLFADLWTKRHAWQVRDSIRAYLFSAVRNRALNIRKRQAMESDWAHEEAIVDVRALHTTPEAADAALDRTELRARLDRAIAALPERCRLVMHLRWREQMPYAEIASVMGISVKGVENQLARGLAALRQRFV